MMVSSKLSRRALASSTALIALLSIATGAQAQNVSAPITTVAPADTGNEIIVLGTRRTDRTVTNSASPIDVISAAELTSQPTGNILDLLRVRTR